MEPEAPCTRGIDIFLRIRPISKPAHGLAFNAEEGCAVFTVPKSLTSGFVNNLKEQHPFNFTGILAPSCSQEEVFEAVGRPVVASSLEGFNATVFAYGQTGSGKTFTMTGGTERYADRGIIPRAVSLVFSEAAASPDRSFVVKVSYLEIYNEVGYDLLDPGRDVRALEDLPRVQAMEQDDGDVYLRNLALQTASTEEEALNLLFLGDTNRAISTTPMNLASSRSHCIFTMHIESRKVGDEMVRRSKLNLVDLAGSERVTRGNLDGNGFVLKEAKYINLSLHYLEQVIIALQERSQGSGRLHVPYRNSMMTTVLRDSLGGNTRSVMIATVHGGGQHFEESISTCRFAQRVALVKNKVTVNEEADPWMVIQRLQQEVRGLKEELSKYKEGAPADTDTLSSNELAYIKSQVESYAQQDRAANVTPLPGCTSSVAAAFRFFKALLDESKASASKPQEEQQPDVQQLETPNSQILQRDKEIAALMALLQRTQALEGKQHQQEQQNFSPAGSYSRLPESLPSALLNLSLAAGNGRLSLTEEMSKNTAAKLAQPRQHLQNPSSTPAARQSLLTGVSDSEAFSRSYRPALEIAVRRQTLKEKCIEAQRHGHKAQDCQARINVLKGKVERGRLCSAMAGTDDAHEAADRESSLLAELNEVRETQKQAIARLRDLKTEIEPLHKQLQADQAEMLAEFAAGSQQMV